MPNIPQKLRKQLATITAAAKEYDKARFALSNAAMSWWSRHGFTSVRDVPAAIGRPFAEAIYNCAQAQAAMQRALGERPARRRPRRASKGSAR